MLLSSALGEIVVDLFCEEDCAPLCAHFLKLCGAKYYHGCLLYNVQPNCVAQCGDPTGTGSGPNDKLMSWKGTRRRKHDSAGLLCLACVEKDTFGAKFFLTLRGEDLEHLDEGGHAVIGRVAEGDDILEKMSNLYLDEKGRPMEDVRLLHTYVLDDPLNEEAVEEPRSPSAGCRPRAETVHPRIDYGKAIETKVEDPEVENEKKAKSQAQVLEMIGDLPHAEVEVPKNELFVCKLNKVTEDHDLEIIFSRFGKVESCDIVRDWKTGDSLNFGFVAFEDEAAAVEAYRKMNGVLIDDSRIKVDFSQSVAKIWSRYTLQYKGAAAKQRKMQLARELAKQLPSDTTESTRRPFTRDDFGRDVERGRPHHRDHSISHRRDADHRRPHHHRRRRDDDDDDYDRDEKGRGRRQRR